MILSANTTIAPNFVQFFWDTLYSLLAVSEYEVHKILGSPRGGILMSHEWVWLRYNKIIAILTFESCENYNIQNSKLKVSSRVFLIHPLIASLAIPMS